MSARLPAHRRRRLIPSAMVATLAAGCVAASLLVLPAAGATAAADATGPAPAAEQTPFAAAVDRLVARPGEPRAPRKPSVRMVPGEAADQCFGDAVKVSAAGDDAEKADKIMAGKLDLGDYPDWDLPADPTWAEDPYGDANWVSRYQRLAWVDVLRREGQRRGDAKMLERYEALLADWAADNPPDAPKSPWAWKTINPAIRSVVYLCKLGRVGPADYLPNLLVQHALYLANSPDYPAKGNHALWMNQALVAIGCATSVAEYPAIGLTRMTDLVRRSIDPEGVSDEGSVSYQKLNWEWYSEAESRVRVCGLTAPPEFAWIGLMPQFLAHALMPDGTPAMIGDTVLDPMYGLEGTPAEWVRTQGASGTPPTELWHTYTRGYAFGRSGWGDATRPAADQAAWWMKFGQAPDDQVHGHEDLGSIELYAFGARLIWDAGLYAYLGGPARSYMVGRAGHNVIDVPSATYRGDQEAPLLAQSHDDAHDMVSVQVNNVAGTNWNRRMLFSRAGGYVLVDDRITQQTYRNVVQRWNLPADRTVSTPLFGGRIVTSGPGPNLVIVQLGDRGTRRVYTGQEDPRWVGWRSTQYRVLQKTPTVETVLSGRNVRYVTLLAPIRAGRTDDVTVSGLQILPDSVSLVVTTGGISEQVTLTETGGSVTPATVTPTPTPVATS